MMRKALVPDRCAGREFVYRGCGSARCVGLATVTVTVISLLSHCTSLVT